MTLRRYRMDNKPSSGRRTRKEYVAQQSAIRNNWMLFVQLRIAPQNPKTPKLIEKNNLIDKLKQSAF
jgi:hypothetical protein